MKRNILIAVALAATMTAAAQNIAVVSPSNETSIYQTLDEAITSEETISGSTIYLPGGSFQVKDESKIDKKLTIMGVSHRGDTDNADGATIIAGNLNFIGGSSGSSVVGAYISGNINVGTAEDAVENLTVRFCNANSIQVSNGASSGLVVNQCYLRNNSNFGLCNVKLENNILHSILNVRGGIINHNVVVYNRYLGYYDYYTDFAGHYVPGDSYRALEVVYDSSITNNFFLDGGGAFHHGENNYASHNCLGNRDWGENCIFLEQGKEWKDVFEKPLGIVISSNYHLKENWVKDNGSYKGTDNTEIGIYGGSTPFSDKAVAPIPRIISKKVDEHSNAVGTLTINVTVKAK